MKAKWNLCNYMDKLLEDSPKGDPHNEAWNTSWILDCLL